MTSFDSSEFKIREQRSHSSPNINYHGLPSRSGNGTLLCNSSAVDSNESLIQNGMLSVDAFSTTAVLHYCKRKILVPYQRFLAVVGWRPLISVDDSTFFRCLVIKVYTIFVVSICILGYILQYAACFRRDILDRYVEIRRLDLYSWSSEPEYVCKGSGVGLYIIPNFLHLVAYIYMFYLLRVCDNEQMQTLMERVFLQAFNSSSGYIMQHKLMKTLRTFVILGIVWVVFACGTVLMHVFTEYPHFTWLNISIGDSDIALTIFMVLGLVWNDMIHAAIVLSYSIQCQLLVSFLNGLVERVCEKSLSLGQAIKDINEVSKIIKYLNEDFSVSVSILMLYSGTLAFSGAYWLLSDKDLYSERPLKIATNISSTVLWFTIFLFPIVQAARVSAACLDVKRVALFLQTRPFGYQEYLQHSLDSFLNFTISIKLQAKLFRIPVVPAALFFLVTVLGFVLLLLIQLDIINIYA